MGRIWMESKSKERKSVRKRKQILVLDETRWLSDYGVMSGGDQC